MEQEASKLSELESRTGTEPLSEGENVHQRHEREVEPLAQETGPAAGDTPAEVESGIPEVPEGESPELSTEVLEAESTPEPRGTRVHPLATFLVGLVIGLLIGYGGRPSMVQPSTAQSQATRTPVLPGQARNTSGAPTLMDTLVAQTRHFKGDPNAPVTIIEFSDFQ